MSSLWSIWIITLFSICLIGLFLLLMSNRKTDLPEDQVKDHVYDGIEEYDNPLPSWFFNLFLASMIFALIYLALYPGLGSFQGLLGWSSQGQWQESVEQAEAEFKEKVAVYTQQAALDLIATREALKMGQRIFKNNCAVCHGSDGKGSYAFPNLTDNDWLFDDTEESIKHTLTYGRQAIMPAWASILGNDINAMSEYVLHMSQGDEKLNEHPMQAKYDMLCASCHGKDGTGNQLLGAPNLSDDIWLYGGSISEIKLTLEQGRQGNMPNFSAVLSEERMHLVTAYVLSLSKGSQTNTTP